MFVLLDYRFVIRRILRDFRDFEDGLEVIFGESCGWGNEEFGDV